jgi:hypothetical protein
MYAYVFTCVSMDVYIYVYVCIGLLKRDGYCAETSFRLSVNRTSAFESAGVSAHSATGSNAGLAMTCLSFTIDGLPTPLTSLPLAQASLRIYRPSRSKRATYACAAVYLRFNFRWFHPIWQIILPQAVTWDCGGSKHFMHSLRMMRDKH